MRVRVGGTRSSTRREHADDGWCIFVRGLSRGSMCSTAHLHDLGIVFSNATLSTLLCEVNSTPGVYDAAAFAVRHLLQSTDSLHHDLAMIREDGSHSTQQIKELRVSGDIHFLLFHGYLVMLMQAGFALVRGWPQTSQLSGPPARNGAACIADTISTRPTAVRRHGSLKKHYQHLPAEPPRCLCWDVRLLLRRVGTQTSHEPRTERCAPTRTSTLSHSFQLGGRGTWVVTPTIVITSALLMLQARSELRPRQQQLHRHVQLRPQRDQRSG
jgi:hypothetical protein